MAHHRGAKFSSQDAAQCSWARQRGGCLQRCTLSARSLCFFAGHPGSDRFCCPHCSAPFVFTCAHNIVRCLLSYLWARHVALALAFLLFQCQAVLPPCSSRDKVRHIKFCRRAFSRGAHRLRRVRSTLRFSSASCWLLPLCSI